MSWLWADIGREAAGVVTALFSVIGYLITQGLVTPLLQDVVRPLLGATLFHPFSLTGPGVVAVAARTVWATLAGVSGAIALVALLWGVFLRTGFAAVGGSRRWGEIGEGAGIYALTLVGGYSFLGLLLTAADTVTRALYASTEAMAHVMTNPATGLVTGAMAFIVSFFIPTALLVLAGVFLWVIATWLMRQVDLIVFLGLLPVTAALALSGNKRPFEWNWQEAEGAVLNQLAMAVAWWIAWVVLTGNGSQPTLVTAVTRGTNLGLWFLHVLLGIAAFGMVARTPAMLQQLTGHAHAGALGVMAGVAGGALIAKGLATSLKLSPGGQALRALREGREARAAETVAGWAAGPSVGERVAQRGVGQRLGQLRAASLSRLAAAGERLDAFAARHGMATPSGLGPVGAARLATARTAASPVGRAAGSALHTARTAASLASQPRVTLGRMAAGAEADQVRAAGVAGDRGTLHHLAPAAVKDAGQPARPGPDRRTPEGRVYQAMRSSLERRGPPVFPPRREAPDPGSEAPPPGGPALRETRARYGALPPVRPRTYE